MDGLRYNVDHFNHQFASTSSFWHLQFMCAATDFFKVTNFKSPPHLKVLACGIIMKEVNEYDSLN